MSKNLKRIRFLKIAPKRTNSIIHLLHLLSNCSNKNNYEYTSEEIQKIFITLKKELEQAENVFLKLQNKESKFEL